MEAEDIVLARRSLIRGVMLRCIEIAEGYCVDENDSSPATHSLRIVKHRISGQVAGFAIQNRDDNDKQSINVFFDGLNVALVYISDEGSEVESEKLWECEVFTLDGSIAGINGVSETPFWENEFQQALKDHLWIITNFNMAKDRMVENGVSVSSSRRAVDVVTKSVLMGSDDFTLEADLIPGSSKNISVKVNDEFAGKLSATAIGHNISSFTKKLRDSRRVSQGDSESFEARAENFISSLFYEAETQRHKAFRDSFGNSIIGIEGSDRKQLSEMFNYSDLLDIIHSNQKATSTMTATEIIEYAKDLYHQNNKEYENKRKEERQGRESKVVERLHQRANQNRKNPDRDDRK